MRNYAIQVNVHRTKLTYKKDNIMHVKQLSVSGRLSMLSIAPSLRRPVVPCCTAKNSIDHLSIFIGAYWSGRKATTSLFKIVALSSKAHIKPW